MTATRENSFDIDLLITQGRRRNFLKAKITELSSQLYNLIAPEDLNALAWTLQKRFSGIV